MSVAQRKFDETHALAAEQVANVAKNSAVVIVCEAPFDNVSLLVEELISEKVTLGEIVVVDATAEEPRLVAIRDHIAAWRRMLPLTRFTVVPYSRQEFRFPHAIEQGWRATKHRYVWIAGRYFVPLPGCFEYLVKTQIVEGENALVVAHVCNPDGTLRAGQVDSAALASDVRAKMLSGESFDLLNNLARPSHAFDSEPDLQQAGAFLPGIFGGPASMLAAPSATLLDDCFITNAAVVDFALTRQAAGISVVRAKAAAAWSTRTEVLDAAAPWEVIHDWRWLLDKRAETVGDSERIELVCPFHRGDVVLSMLVALEAVARGKKIRVHVATGLVEWAKQFGAGIDVEAVPVPVASAEETYPQLLASYLHVSQRSDASPRIARCHPSRGLSETGQNLVEYILEEVGLPTDTLLPNSRLRASADEQRVAEQVLQQFGRNVVFVHPLGGWSLKSIPAHVMLELAELVHEAGYKLIQIGGASDRRVDGCDGAILQNFMPSQWSEILTNGRALVGVDSWTAHFGALLDLPQVCLYGSTHPKHVYTKPWFAKQSSECLVLAPIVNCSPCNSLTCISFPERNYCTGYAIDREALRDFLANKVARPDDKNSSTH
ncbi:glycosyltransferase family 9 protein [Paraburkholderia largidicola]|uniref:glycosyltransferase family 9 protein n=1 Tax=Paraburkholderia largidicola TaxID=3014751 RepID=UPI0015D9A005|nr:glycosyltransferase family 9 protein [Paraburkholderia sp. PGU16]